MKNRHDLLCLLPSGYLRFKIHYMKHKQVSYEEFLKRCSLNAAGEQRIKYSPPQQIVPQKVVNAAALWICEYYNLEMPDLLDPCIFDAYMVDWIKEKSIGEILEATGYESKDAFKQSVNRHATVLIGRILKYDLKNKNINLNDMQVWDQK